jgi:hypothetical protein
MRTSLYVAPVKVGTITVSGTTVTFAINARQEYERGAGAAETDDAPVETSSLNLSEFPIEYFDSLENRRYGESALTLLTSSTLNGE